MFTKDVASLLSSTHGPLAVIVLASIFCYINSLGCDFVFDDQSAIKSNKDVRPTTPLSELFLDDFWGTSMDDERSHGSYRPLCTLTFRMNYIISALEPMVYHAVNVLLHAAASFLAYWCLISLSFSHLSSWIAALMFAVHPVHTEAVTGVVGRAELLSAVFFFFAIICYVLSTKEEGSKKFVLLLSAILSIPLAALSKETGITVAGLMLFYEALVFAKWQPSLPFSSLKGLLNRHSLIRIGAVLATTVGFLFIRLKLMPRMPHFSILDNPAAHSPAPTKQLTFAYLVPLNALLLVYPWPLVADWALGTVPLIRGWEDPRNIITGLFFILLVMVIVATIVRLKQDHRLALCFALIVVPFIPASNLFFPVGFVVAERVLYLPSFGWCGLVAVGFERIIRWLSHRFDGDQTKVKKKASSLAGTPVMVVCYVFAAILAAFFFRSYLRNFEWNDQVSLFRSGLRFNQRNAKIFNNVGHTYEAKNEWNEAFAYFYKAVRTHPTDVGAHRNVARALKNLNQLKFSERALRRAISLIPTHKTVPAGVTKVRVTPAHLDAFLDLASLLALSGNTKDLVEAESLYSKVMEMRPDYLSGFERRGELMFKLGRLDEARRMFQEALRHNSRCANCYYNLAVVDITQFPNDVEKLSAALISLDTALKMDPEHYHAMHAFASVVQERRAMHLYDQARKYLQQVIANEKPDNEPLMSQMGSTVSESVAKLSDAYFRAAMMETDLRNFDKAEELYLAALKKDPMSRSILFNLAWLNYKDLNMPIKALPYLERLLKSHPNNSNAWLLLGYVHLNHTHKFDKALEAFEAVVKVAPFEGSKADQASTIATSQFEICRVYEKQNFAKKAVKCLEQLLKQYPNDNLITNELSAMRSRHKIPV